MLSWLSLNFIVFRANIFNVCSTDSVSFINVVADAADGPGDIFRYTQSSPVVKYTARHIRLVACRFAMMLVGQTLTVEVGAEGCELGYAE